MACADYCFPSRLEEISILEEAIRTNSRDKRAAYYLGNLFYDRKRLREAITLWESVAKRDRSFSTVWRNLGIAYYNVCKKPMKANIAYDNAFKARPRDSRILYERDQLCKQLGTMPDLRLREIEKHRELAMQRDDLSVELCALYNQIGQHAEALKIISGRNFQPWEGGEGLALGQHIRTHLLLGRAALSGGDAVKARGYFERALTTPRNLNEANHLLANRSDVHYWLATALCMLGDSAGATQHWRIAAEFRGDFQEMSVCPFSEMTYFSALSMKRLGDEDSAHSLLTALLAYARELASTEAKIDYFATSLPTMLLFEDDIQLRQETHAKFLEAQALLGLGRKDEANACLVAVLTRDPNHALAEDFLRQIDSTITS
jgi:tetratricopeptide (TPR) repeat protein